NEFLEREQRRLTEKGENFDSEAYQEGGLAIYKAQYNPLTKTLFFRSPLDENEIITFSYDKEKKVLMTGNDKNISFAIVNMSSKQEKFDTSVMEKNAETDPFSKAKLNKQMTNIWALASRYLGFRPESIKEGDIDESHYDFRFLENVPLDIEVQIDKIETEFKDQGTSVSYMVDPYLKSLNNMPVKTPASKMQLDDIAQAHERFIEELNYKIEALKGKKLSYLSESPYSEKENYFREQAERLSQELEEAYRSGSQQDKEIAALRSVRAYFEEMSFKYMGAENNIESLMKGFLSGLNVLMYGPPGSAKTKMARTMIDSILEVMNEEQMIDLVKELGDIYHELKKKGVDLGAFEKQFHPMSSEMDIFGISDIGALERDEVKMIRDKSIVAKRFLFALLDEFEKAPVSLRTAMLSILNERVAKDTGHPEKVNIYTIILITNSTPGEFIQAFDKSEFEKAYPVLSRIHQSTYVFNKLSDNSTHELIRRMVYGFDMKIHNKLPIYQVKSLIEKYDYEQLIELENVLARVENKFMNEMFHGKSNFLDQLGDFLNGAKASFYYPTAGYDNRRIVSVFRKELVPAIIMRRVLRGDSVEDLVKKDRIDFEFQDLIAFMEIYTTSSPLFKFKAEYDNEGIMQYKVVDLTEEYGQNFMNRLNSREKEAIENIQKEMVFIANQMSVQVKEYLKELANTIYAYPEFFPDLFASQKDRIYFLKRSGFGMEEIMNVYGKEGADLLLEIEREIEGN
ncbi:MAG: ATP-binding protein, partial [Bdellovibrionota bacterium]|nr:ATP-binding protein [Bdellovibrionota bacterium]